MFRITIPQAGRHIEAAEGSNLMHVLRDAGCIADAPCGGRGTCGKCKVIANEAEVQACRTMVDRDLTVEIPAIARDTILAAGLSTAGGTGSGYRLAFDLGTTTLVGFLLDGAGTELACETAGNPQRAFGGDVISRIQYALKTDSAIQTRVIREKLAQMTKNLCQKQGIHPGEIRILSIVGNPAMRQLFLGISPENLAKLPFSPVLTETKTVPAAQFLPCCEEAILLLPPDIAGFVGTDTLACLLATEFDRREDWTLLVDIGTNGEMILGRKSRMIACSTAAGPALEGANISCGMRGQPGAIDHVWTEGGHLRCSVIGNSQAEGICGSGLIDAAAAALELGLVNQQGRVQTEDRCIPVTENIKLTQDDIRQLQLAKGAIAAGIQLMTEHLEIEITDIHKVYLAGAFGTFLNPASACRIGLLPRELEGKTEAIGNAAGSGAKWLACREDALAYAGDLAGRIEFLELASVPDFQYCFAENMWF